ncbi:MAG: ROK family protein [Dehalococcoidia bacterium]|nr:ROK family protein [Dehalococcoidia bacterium]
MPENKEQKLILGVDLGGTKIAAALATAQGKILARGRSSTRAQAGPDVVIKSICATIDRTLAAKRLKPSQFLGIGIAAAGIIDSDKGKVISSPNLPGWHEVPLRDAVEQRFGIPTYLGNDATLAALGEWCFGLKKGIANLIYITVSTGIGGGIIAGGKLYTGACGVAGEIGHMTIDVNGPKCNCGNIGCWETLASGTALAREAVKQIREGAKTSIIELVNGDISKIDAKVVDLAAKQGDELAKELISRLGYYLGIGLVNLVNIFNPELILIGGGVAKMGDLLLQPAIKIVKERAFSTPANAVEIKPALLGDDSGILGAVAFVLERSKNYRR